jgi:hypothetical protein
MADCNGFLTQLDQRNEVIQMLIFKYASISLISNSNSADRQPMKKHYIKAQQLLDDSFKLAWQVYESGYRPNYIVGVWRGGAPIGIACTRVSRCSRA